VVCSEDGVALHRHGTVRAAILQAFDLLGLNGEDLRPVMLGERKARLARLLARATRDRAQRAHRRGRRHGVPARLRDGIGGDRLEAPGNAIPVRPLQELDQGQEPGQPRHTRGSRGTVVIRFAKGPVQVQDGFG
jgi:hypothetical protein